MSEEQILEKLKAIIEEQLGTEVDQINMKSSLSDDLQADSLDKVVMLMAAEKEFGIKFSDEVSMGFETISDIVKYIKENV